MALSTASIIELRERNNAQIDLLQEELTSASLPYRGRLREKALRLDRLFAERVTLEKASTSVAQRARYGVERWNQLFIRLRDIRQIAGCSLTAQELRSEVWRAIPPG